jgi:hypothetical protein
VHSFGIPTVSPWSKSASVSMGGMLPSNPETVESVAASARRADSQFKGGVSVSLEGGEQVEAQLGESTSCLIRSVSGLPACR